LELTPDQLNDLDPLVLSNTITISALVGVLVKKGVLTSAELAGEIRELRARIGGGGGGGGVETPSP
jgi:hypothetical protein